MASIELLPRKEFSLIFDDGAKVTGQFGTYALNKFCQDKKIKLSEVSEHLKTDESMADLIDYILSAAYQSFKYNKTEGDFTITDVDIYKWIDQIGGFDSPAAMSLFSHASDSTEEKKTETPPADN